MKKMRLINLIVVLFLTIGFLFTGCYPNNDQDIQDYDLAITMKNPNFEDYDKIHTYFLPDFVSHGDNKTPDKAFDQSILDAVETNLKNIGWQAVEFASDADVVVFCSAINTDVYSYWYNYWYPYWDAYYPGYYPYYPWPYFGGGYGGVTYNYSEGTVAIQMNYTKPDNNEDGEDEEDEATKTPIIWLGIIDGVLNDTPNNVKDRIAIGVDQCFKNSEYLKGK